MRHMAKRPERTTREAIVHFFRSLYQIGRIAYDAAPIILVSTVVIRIFQSLIPVALAFVFKLIFDRLGLVLAGESAFAFQEDVLPFILAFGVLNILSQSLIALDVYINEEMGRRLQLHTSRLVYTHLLSLKGMDYFESPKFHDKLQQSANQLQWMPMQLIRSASGLLGSMLTLLSFFGIVLFLSPILALVLIIATIPSFIVQLRFRRKRFDMSWHNSPKERKMYYFGSVLSNTHFAKEVRLFNLGNYILDKYISTTQDVHQEQRALNQEELKFNTGLNVLQAVVMVGTYIFVIAQAFAQSITLGDVTLYIEAVRNVQQQLSSLSWTVVSLSERTLFFSHYQDLIAMQSTLAQYDPQHKLQPLQSQIELCGVSFRYTENADYVLKDINLTIKKGESLAVVGLNGAGKTTLVKLLARFYDPTEGKILWDGIDVRHFSPDDLRERLGAVLQDFTKYDMSARENIGLGNTAYIDDTERIKAVAQEVGVDEFITDLPQGYETILSRWLVDTDDDGTDLSGGQWQKIAISRTYLRDVDVLMLDEPTAALDAEAEYDIYQRFDELSKDRATLLISHRFSTVRIADKIAVIGDGQIKEYGTHSDLIAQDGTYAHLYSLQAQQYA